MHLTPYQLRKLERLLVAEDLSRAELARALAGFAHLEDWLLRDAAGPDFLPTSLEAVLTRNGTQKVERMIQRFLREPAITSAG